MGRRDGLVPNAFGSVGKVKPSLASLEPGPLLGLGVGAGVGVVSRGPWTLKRNGAFRPGLLNGEGWCHGQP